MNLKTIIEWVKSIIASEHLSSIVRELTEVGVDPLVKEGLLRDIPIVNILHSSYQIGVAIDQQLFTKKIQNFLEELSNVSYEERLKFVEWIEQMEQNPKEKGKFGETLLLLIDSADSLEKPSIVGRLFKHHILEKISYEDAMRLSYIVNRVYMSDLNYLTSFTPGTQSNPDIAASLQSAGLLKLALSMDFGYLDEPSPAGIIYELNNYGDMLLKYGLDSAV